MYIYPWTPCLHNAPRADDKGKRQAESITISTIYSQARLSRWANILAQKRLVGNGDDTALSLLAGSRAGADEVVNAGDSGGG
jgi:hypothetical protein